MSERCTSCHLYKGEGDDEGSEHRARARGLRVDRVDARAGRQPRDAETYREKALDPAMKKHMPRFDKRPVARRRRRRRPLDPLHGRVTYAAAGKRVRSAPAPAAGGPRSTELRTGRRAAPR